VIAGQQQIILDRRVEGEWRQIPTPGQYDVMRAQATEAPGSCALLLEKRAGIFSCAGCGRPLFESRLIFESGTRWPTFNDPIEGADARSITARCGQNRSTSH
jgi:peptide-methionine (R)-S-oxide reductase